MTNQSPSAILPTWAQIRLLDEYITDHAFVYNTFVSSLGTMIVQQNEAFVRFIVDLVCIKRYFIRHLPDIVDLDRTPYFEELAKQYGYDLPFLQNYSAIELLRENKRWYGTKSTTKLVPFAGDLINSPLRVDNPGRLVFRFSDPNCVMSGAKSTSGPLPMAQSKLGRFQDNRFWTYFVYVVEVLQAQNAVGTEDLISILDNIHPAGFLRYDSLNWNEIGEEADEDEPGSDGETTDMEAYGMNVYVDKGFSNGLRFSDPNSLFDNATFHDATLNVFNWVEYALITEAFSHLTFGECDFDMMKQVLLEARSWVSFERYVQLLTTESQEVALIVTSTQSFDFTLPMTDDTGGLIPNTVKIYFEGDIVARDDGAGVLTFIDTYPEFTGTVDYITGEIEVTVTDLASTLDFTAVANAEYWQIYYPDTDELIALNSATNVGVKDYQAVDIQDLTVRHVKSAAVGLDDENPDQDWLSDGVSSWIVEPV